MEAIRCTEPTCRCSCFSPGKSFLRICDTCKHGWVSHALEKLGNRSTFQLGMQVEIVQPNIVFDIASLILYGAQATPIRLKILLDRLFSVLQHDEVLQVLHGFGWSYEDYARGYILQDSSGRVLDKWIVTTREEEHVILQQFLRFGETKSIAQEIIHQDTKDNRSEKTDFEMSPKSESEIKKFIERSNVGMQSFMRGYDSRVLAKPFPTTSVNLTRLLTPTSGPAFPSPGKRDAGGMLLPVSPANSLTGSPLTRLQTMQPFDYRREHSSPTISPSASDKSASSANRSEMLSPQNLSYGALTPNSSFCSVSPEQMLYHSPVKAEMAETKNMLSPGKQDLSGMDGVLNFSLKDQKSLANTPPRHRPQSPLVHGNPRPEQRPRTPPATAQASSHYADQKIKHLRKSSNPMKRPWQPTPGYGGTLISPSGKKRVLCTACNKTFCDKGALKIHYSAVHLKEMHKCSVEGCHMMFSSRRSRNRHSANPNPKLHMPQARRKLNEDSMGNLTDEQESSDRIESEELPTLQRMQPIMPGLINASNAVMHEHNDQPKDLSKEHTLVLPTHPVVTTTNASGEMIYYLDPAALAGIPQQLLPITPNSQGDDIKSENSDDTAKCSSGKGRSSRKRKCLQPTRCTQISEDAFVMSDEEGMGGAMNGHKPFSKSRRLHEETSSRYNSEDEHVFDEEESLSENGAVETISGEESSPNSPSASKSKPGVNTVNSRDEGDESSMINGKPAGDNNDDDDDDDNDDADNDDEDENGFDVDDIPIDKDNPKKCSSCGKTFPNLFTVKTHYQNVHLRLMHTCTVDGCNAAFPSKRSRDRHSSNLNLHRKLLSTNIDAEGQSLRDEFLPRIYDQPTSDTEAVSANESLQEDCVEANNNNEDVNGRDDSHEESDDDSGVEQHDGDSDDTDVYSTHTANGKDLGPDPDPAGTAACHVCSKMYRDNLILKEHFEKNHPREMFRCTIKGCDKIFSTRKSRNRHSQNDNLHRHIGVLNGVL